MKKIIPILIIVLIVAGGVGWVVFTNLAARIPENDPYLAGNTGGNLLNGGMFCEADGKVYFANSYDNNALYVMNSDETDIKKLNDYNVLSINVGGNFIYFVQGAATFTGDGFGVFRSFPGLYRSRINGKDITTLKAENVPTATLCGNEIYYQDFTNANGHRLFKMNLDGSGDQLLSTDLINPSSYANGLIYYSDDEDDYFVHSIDVLYGGSTSVVLEANTYNAIYDNGYIYFMDQGNNYRLCRYSTHTNTIEILTHDRVDGYNVGHGVIFYQKNSRTEPALIRMNDNGSNPVIIREGNHEKINITSQFVYFREFGDDVTTYRTSLYGTPYAEHFMAAWNAAQ